MALVRGCEVPDDFYYDIDANVWVRDEGADVLAVGMTSYACSLSGIIVAYTPRRVGKEVRKGKSCATVESGKWVGPVRSPVSGEIVAINAPLDDDPSIINHAPYTDGWIVKIRPFEWNADRRDLVTGLAAVQAYEKKMDEEGFGGC